MGHIQDRWYRPKRDPETGAVVLTGKGKPVMERTELHGRGMRYRVRYLDPDGTERARTFPDKQKKRAEDFLIEVESDKREGKYVDPRAGRVSFRSVASRWVQAQTFDYTTRERVESRVATHLLPFFEGRSIGSVKPSDVQAWLRWLQDRQVAPASRVLYFSHLVSVFSFAQEDKLIVTNPARSRSVTRPREDTARVQPWSGQRARAVLDAMPERYRPAVWVASGLGLRSGEVFGFSLEDVDRDRNVVRVERQVRLVENRPVFAPPKRGKSREVPIGAALLDDLDAYAARFPPTAITLPWLHPSGEPVTVKLVMVNGDGMAVRRTTFRTSVWLPALKRAGIEHPTRADGMHALRHLYASVLLDAGESVKAVSEYLGHTDPGFTLRVYTHLLPSSHERTRKALDAFFGMTLDDGPDLGRAA
ncbi:site-specific integrase [Saccharomonospora piscinae]|uniref:Site-specific integrase n=1 Tax=Saccharomonospora piscinae TaxID=687388 RepID=A0A1V9A5L9_SACPI|nr:site-specific integrase [Saccharomonospora piscinae]OQO92445.1 site-specific integrase [Saccharomonospora piscinae]